MIRKYSCSGGHTEKVLLRPEPCNKRRTAKQTQRGQISTATETVSARALGQLGQELIRVVE